MHSGPEIMRQLGYILLAFVQDSVFVLSAYQSVMSLFGFWQRRKPPLKNPVTRFAVLVAAHNEAHVIRMHSGPEIMRQLGYILLAFVQDSVFVLSAYQSVMSLFGFWQRRKPPLKDPVTR